MNVSQILFWIAIFYAVYIVALYPAGLSLLARLSPAPVQRAPYTPSVSIILASHNGAAFLLPKMDSIRDLDYPPDLLQVIVVDDGSTDDSPVLLRNLELNATVILAERSGKAGALNLGLAAATGEIVVLTDVRQRLAHDSLRLLLENFADSAAGAVSAELQIQSGTTTEQENIGAYWRYERWIRLNLSAVDSIFGASGSYYAIRRDLVVPIPIGTLLDDMYLPLHAFFRGYRLLVDPRAKMYDYPTSLTTEFRRKVRTLAGNYQILRSYPQLLGPSNRLWIHFVSYKFGRLLLPFALAVAGVASFACGGRLMVFSAAIQITAYAAALADPHVPEGAFVKRLTSPIRTFIVMMLATACAISILFVSPDRLWRKTSVARPDVVV